MNDLSLLQTEFVKKLDSSMSALGFTRRRQFVYIKSIYSDAYAYIFCRPTRKDGALVVSPIVAIENMTLRKLIGEDEPLQDEPRIANVYLAHSAGLPHMSWVFKSRNDLIGEFDSMIAAISSGGIPFAERWASFDGARELVAESWAGRAPKGVIIHPTSDTEDVLKRLST